LSIAIGVLLRAGVAHTDVEKAVGAECKPAAVVNIAAVVHLEHQTKRLAAVAQQIIARSAFQNMRREVAVLDKVLHDEIATIAGILRMKSYPQQTSGASHESAGFQKNRLRFPAR